jgi:hypothetical protein
MINSLLKIYPATFLRGAQITLGLKVNLGHPDLNPWFSLYNLGQDLSF